VSQTTFDDVVKSASAAGYTSGLLAAVQVLVDAVANREIDGHQALKICEKLQKLAEDRK